MQPTAETPEHTPAKYNTPLRQAQRDLTRSRIKRAARQLFHDKRFEATTMDEIAVAAGLRRSTLYFHYKDKADILQEVIADYRPKAKAVLSEMPGPTPDLAALLLWIRKVTRFIKSEQVPLSIIRETRLRSRNNAQYEDLTNELLAALGTRNPVFIEASRPNGDPLVRARGLSLLNALIYACAVYLEDVDNARGKAMLQVAAEDIFAFVRQ